MISSILACILPIVMGLDADLSARIQVGPGIAVGMHPDSYYDQREKERQNNQARAQAERADDQRRQESFGREQTRGNGSLLFWRDTKDQHARKQQDLMVAQRQREQVRANREQSDRDEANRDRDERNHRQDDRH